MRAAGRGWCGGSRRRGEMVCSLREGTMERKSITIAIAISMV